MTESSRDSRNRIQQVIETARQPLTVDDIVVLTGLHANTVRGHLEVLLAGDSITREQEGAQGRGRPRWLYRGSTPTASAFQFLAEALSTELTQARDPALAESAAERWAHALPELPIAHTPDDAVDEATSALNRLGFTAERTPIGDAICVTSCPYADLVAEHPVICEIHTSLVAKLFKQTGQPVTIEAMDVWARPGMCVAHLSRPDLHPARTIAIDEHGTIVSTEGNAS